MATNSFDGIFYIKKAPSIRYEDGLFFVCYDVGKVHVEFVMQPSVYIKTHSEAERAFKEFTNGKTSVTPLRGRRNSKPSH